MEPIVADQIQLEEDAEGVTLSCRLTGARLDLPARLWYCVPRQLASFVPLNGDPFLPVVMLAGMKHGRDIVIESDVSDALLASSRQIMSILHAWSQRAGDDLAVVDVDAATAARQRHGSATGAFFSGGVDSFYTLLKNHRRYPADDSRLISRLILLHGFDIRLDQADLFDLTYRHAREAAHAFGKELVPVKTNAHRVLEGLDWGKYAHGGVLAGAGLSLAGLFHTLFIAASYHFFDLFPWASHPAIDPLWSTEGLEFVHDGSEAARPEKVRFIASSPAALRSLRVCWENREGAYNCGKCEKCLRTMMDLFLCGALERAEVFPKTIDLDAVARLTPSPIARVFWRGTLERLRASGADRTVVTAIERALEKGAWSESRIGRADYAMWRHLSSWGLTPERMKRIDARLFRGNLVKWARHLQKRTAR